MRGPLRSWMAWLVAALSAMTLPAHGVQHATESEPLIHRAAREGDVRTLTSELARDPAAAKSRFGENDETPLMVAARSRDATPEIIRLLTADPAALEARAADGRTALLIASGHGSADIVAALRDLGASVAAKDEDSRTGLMLAARRNSVETLEILLPGTDLEAGDDAGWTALMHAVWSKDDEKVTLLLRAGSDPGHVAKDGATAMHIAARQGRPELIDPLVDAVANVLLPDHAGRTPLMLAAASCEPPVLASLVARIASQPGALDMQDALGTTALMVAATSKDLARASILIDAGASIDARDHSGRTALFHAAAASDAAMADMLIERGASRKIANRAGVTPLMIAAGLPGADVLSRLHVGADSDDFETKSNTGLTALMFAARTGPPQSITLLLAAGADANASDSSGETPLMIAAGTRDEDAPMRLSLLLTAGAQVGIVDHEGRTALMHAAETGRPESIRTLLDASAEVNARSETGATALALAATRSDRQSTAILQALLASHAEANFADHLGITPLMLAGRRGRVETIVLLVQAGAFIDATDAMGRTALFHATQGARIDRVQALLDAGADASIADARGRTAAMEARDLKGVGDSEEIVRVLHGGGPPQ